MSSGSTDDPPLYHNLTAAVLQAPLLVEPISAIVAPIVFAIVFLFGIIGNSLQLLTVVGNRSLRHSPPNVLIACLGAADLALLLVCVPFVSIVYTLPRWPFGRTVCKLSQSVQTLSVAVSVLTLTALSCDRYIAIVHPLTALRSKSLRRTLSVVGLIWIVSVAVAVPDFLASEVYAMGPCGMSACSNATSDDAVVAYCDAHPPAWGMWYAPFRATMRMILLFLLPLMAIAAFYCGVACTLLHSEAPREDRKIYTGPGAKNVVQSPGIAAMFEHQEKERKRVAKVT